MRATSAVRMLAINKRAPEPNGARPPVRPVAPGNVSRRATTRAVVSSLKSDFLEVLQPHQVAVGAPGGLTDAVFAVRADLEQRPGLADVDADISNAYNEVTRASICRAYARQTNPALRAVGRFRHDLLAAESAIYFESPTGLVRAPFASSEGVQQGDPAASADFAFALQPALVAYDAFLRPHAGYALAIADDVHARCPPHLAARGLHVLNDELRPLGLSLGLPKCGIRLLTNPAALIPIATPHSTDPSDPSSVSYTIQGIPVSLAPGFVYGGVPIGAPTPAGWTYVQAHLAERLDSYESDMTTIEHTLLTRHPHAMFVIGRLCLRPRVHVSTTSYATATPPTSLPSSAASTPVS